MIQTIARLFRRWRVPVTAAICAIVSYFFFAPIFEGYTLSDIANRKNQLYPWAYKPTERLETLHYDQADTFYPWQVFMSNALKSGDFPLWNPYSFAGHPFFANGQNGLLYPPRTYLSMFASPTRVHDILLFAHTIAGGVMMFLFLTRVRLSSGASLFGALTWMVNSFMLSWMALEHYVVIHAFLPLAMLLMTKAIKGRSLAAAVWLGIILSLMFLGGNILFILITFVALGGYGAYLLVRRFRRLRRSGQSSIRRPLLIYGAVVAVPALIFAGLIAVQFLPTLDVVRAIERTPLTYTELVKWKVPYSELVCFFTEPEHWINTPLGTGEEPYHRMFFLGLPAAIFALIGFFRKHHLVAYMRVLAALTLLAALGTPLAWVFFKVLPGFGHLKPMGRILFLFNFAAVILAAFGLDWLLKRLPRLIRLPGGNVRLIWNVIITVAPTVIVVLQLHSVANWVMRYELDRPGTLYAETPLIQALKKEPNPRMFALHPSFYGSTSMVFGIENAGGYDSLLPNRTTRLWRVIGGGAVNDVVTRSTTGAFATTFSVRARFYMLPRVGVSHIVTAPMPPVLGCKGVPSAQSVFKLQNPATGDKPIPVVGDWNGDGFDTIGLYDSSSGTFNLWNSNRGDDPFSIKFGPPGKGWLPISGDWDGKRRDTVGLYDPESSTFYFQGSSIPSLQYGPPGQGWIPIAGDWNGDDLDTIGLFDPKKSQFHLKNPIKGRADDELDFSFGPPGEPWVPVVGDWNADKVDTVGLFNAEESTFHLRNLNAEGMTDMIVQYGPEGHNLVPLTGYWNRGVSRGRLDVVGIYDPDLSSCFLCSPSFFDGQKLEHIYAGGDGDVYKVSDAMPRAYVVYQSERVASADAALARLTDTAFDPARAVILEQAVADSMAGSCQAGTQEAAAQPYTTAEVVSHSLNSMTVRAVASQPGWLVVNESWDDGWTATVDGKPAPVVPGNYAFRTVCLPPGEHIIQMVYSPTSFIVGRAMSGFTLLILLGLGAVRIYHYLR